MDRILRRLNRDRTRFHSLLTRVGELEGFTFFVKVTCQRLTIEGANGKVHYFISSLKAPAKPLLNGST
jgi:hypothetical protein